jgi:hypothetical protein
MKHWKNEHINVNILDKVLRRKKTVVLAGI